MNVEKLSEGQEVHLEVIWGAKTIPIKTEIISIPNDSSINVKPYIYNDTPLDLAAGNYKDVFFNLYAIDPDTGIRKVWKGIEYTFVKGKDKSYYSLQLKHHRKIAADHERRQHGRMLLDIKGFIEMPNDGFKSIVIHDISDSGIAIYGPHNLIDVGDVINLVFDDTAGRTGFNLEVTAKMVRKQEVNNHMLYAGTLVSVQDKMLLYLCLKRMEQRAKRAKEKEEKEKAERLEAEKEAQENEQ